MAKQIKEQAQGALRVGESNSGILKYLRRQKGVKFEPSTMAERDGSKAKIVTATQDILDKAWEQHLKEIEEL